MVMIVLAGVQGRVEADMRGKRRVEVEVDGIVCDDESAVLYTYMSVHPGTHSALLLPYICRVRRPT
jgi:hypothetical protein